jgi:Phytanoyl-CoA dioxygenase (PhyH)
MTTTQQKSLKEEDLFLENIPWCESPFFEELLAKSAYNEKVKEQIRFFSENGYLVINPEIEGFDQVADNIIQSLSEQQKKHGSRVQDAWRYQEEIRKIATHHRILEWLKILYQREPIPFQTLNFSKGTEQATHSDLIHFSSVPSRFMAGVWFALEDVDQNNGALHYFPGSQKLPVFDLHDIGMSKSTLKTRDNQYKNYESFVKRLMEKSEFKKATVAIKKGSCLIWSANLFHGGDPIVDKSRTRHTQVTHYYFEGCRYYNPLYSDVHLGDVAWKQIYNINTDQIVPHTYNKKQVTLPLKIRARYYVENLLQNNKIGREIFAKAKKLLTK